MKPMLAHLLPVEREPEIGHRFAADEVERGWLLRLPRASGAPKLLGSMRWDRLASAWWASGADAPSVMVEAELALSPRTLVYCADCAQGHACDAWSYGSLDDQGFYATPLEHVETRAEAAARVAWERIEAWANARVRAWSTESPGQVAGNVVSAAAVLGVAWPCTHAEVTKAFRAAALRTHADQGGNDEAFKRVVAARATLEQALGIK